MTAAHLQAVGAAAAIRRELVAAPTLTADEAEAHLQTVGADICNRMAIIRASADAIRDALMVVDMDTRPTSAALNDIDKAIAATCRIAAALTGGAMDDNATKETK